jgi:hypothetical protein
MTRSELLEAIASIWKPDKARTRWRDDGFDWTPGSHLVRVRVVPPPAKNPGQPERWGLSAQTEFLNSPPIDHPRFTHRLAVLAPYTTSMYALVYPPHSMWKKYSDGEPPVLRLFSSVYVGDDALEWLPRLLCQVALLQAVNAELQSEHLAREVGGKPAFIGSARALAHDEVLDTARDFYVREGAEPSRWSNVSEFAEFAEQYAQGDACFGFSDETGMMLETPFGHDTALIRFRFDEPHPQLGNGLLVTMQLPFISSKDGPIAEAAYLNFLEAKFWTDVPQLGCWHTDARGKAVAHSCFVPNALYVEGLAANLALYSLDRVRWVRKTQWPKLNDKPMGEIIDERMRNGVYP